MADSQGPVTVFLPTWNGGQRLDEVLSAVRAQRTQRRVDIYAIDSGSRDGTREVLAKHGAQYERILQRDFSHGATRNRGVAACRTEIVVLLSQDAKPADPDWLEELLAPFADSRVAGAWSRQVPQPDCHPFQRVNLSAHSASAARCRVVEPVSPGVWNTLSTERRAQLLTFDNVSSAVRRSVLAEHPFPVANFGEDMAWARRVLLAGHRLVFAVLSRVEHSHPVNRSEFFERVILTHSTRRRLTGYDSLPLDRDVERRVRDTTHAFAASVREWTEPESFERRVGELEVWPYALQQIWGTRLGARRTLYQAP